MRTTLAFVHSILLSIAHSQNCGNTHDGSLLLSISVNGNSVDKIGQSTYLSVIEQAAEEITQDTNQDIGVNWFGGDADSVQVGEVEPMGSSPSDISSALSTIAGYDFDTQYGNSVSSAMSSATTSLSGQSGQRYHVVFSAGNPLAGNWGDTTNPTNFDDPCGNSITAKQSRIQTYVALIGTQGIHFVKEYYQCLVDDPSTDIIIIDPDSPSSGISELEALLCKTNGYDVRITEVNPITPTSNSAYKPFIEILNLGATASVKACWSSTSTCSSAQSIAAGEYLVARYNSAGTGSNPTGDATATDLPNQPDGENSWTALAVIGSTAYDTVEYGSTGSVGSSYWQVYQTDRSFELRGLGYNNDYGGNWRASCGSNLNGSPGEAPSDCVDTTDSCSDLQGCDANGAQDSECQTGQNYCGCTSGFLEDVDTCIDVPIPSTTCDAYVIGDEVTGNDFIYFAVDRVDWDGSVSYVVEYPTSSGTNTKVSGVSTVAVSDFDSDILTLATASITVTTSYNSILSGQSLKVDTAVTCSVTTMDPTASPTVDPTKAPTPGPTENPTPAPTFDDPGVYMKSSRFSNGLSRANCFQELRSCCTPFGDQYGDDLTDGTVPQDGCNHEFYAMEIQNTEQDLKQESITLQMYPDGFDIDTEVFYSITSYGVVNSTELELMLWSNETAMNATNDLNIYMYPPGMGTTFSGSVMADTVVDNVLTGQIPLNVTTETISCDAANEECVTYEQCQTSSLLFKLELTSCNTSDSSYGTCGPIYPYVVWVSATRSTELCAIIYDMNNNEDELPNWFWWVLIALLVFMVFLAWLIYRFWWKQKKTATELGDAEDELDQQKADNEAGFGKDLDVGDVAFNPMATGVPGMDRPTDVYESELHQRQMQAQNQMVNENAVVFQVRQDYGQVATGPRTNHYG